MPFTLAQSSTPIPLLWPVPVPVVVILGVVLAILVQSVGKDRWERRPVDPLQVIAIMTLLAITLVAAAVANVQ